MLKVGDTVKVREDLERGEYYEGTYCNNSMVHFAGDIVTIASVRAEDEYAITEDDGCWTWNEAMFEQTELIQEKYNLEQVQQTIANFKEIIKEQQRELSQLMEIEKNIIKNEHKSLFVEGQTITYDELIDGLMDLPEMAVCKVGVNSQGFVSINLMCEPNELSCDGVRVLKRK